MRRMWCNDDVDDDTDDDDDDDTDDNGPGWQWWRNTEPPTLYPSCRKLVGRAHLSAHSIQS